MKKTMKFYEKMPGTHRQRNRAKHVLMCEKVIDGWNITGGREIHKVIQVGTDLTCDCIIFKSEDRLCSHIIKVQMELGLFPASPVLVKKSKEKP
jgi:hypothetical protein